MGGVFKFGKIIHLGTYLVCCRYKCVLVPVHVEWCVWMSDGFRLKALGILLGSMRYGVACGSHCIVWQVVASCGMEEGGGLKVVVKEGVKDRVGEDGVLVIELVVVRGFFVYIVSF